MSVSIKMTTESVTGPPSSSPSHGSIFQQLESYPFNTEPEFQSGLSTILSSSTSTPQDPELLILRARCFYFSRKHNVPIDFNSYLSWRAAQDLPAVTTISRDSPPSKAQTNGTAAGKETNEQSTTVGKAREQPPAPYPTSFSQIVDLITKGEPIPGIKEVPDTLLTGQQSAPTAAKRKKPWENDEVASEAQGRTLSGQR